MKHIITVETVKVSLILHIVFYLSFFPLIVESVNAQYIDVEGPVISHFPQRVARFERKMTIRAHIFDENDIVKVTLILSHGEQTIRGTMPQNTADGTVPVEAFTKYQAPLFSGPGSEYAARTTIRQGELVGVSRIKNNYARILSATGIRGYVNTEALEVVTNGSSFGVTIPPSMTTVDSLQYQIEAVDDRGNVTLTDKIKVRFMTQAEIQTALERLRAGESNVVWKAPSQSSSFVQSAPTSQSEEFNSFQNEYHPDLTPQDASIAVPNFAEENDSFATTEDDIFDSYSDEVTVSEFDEDLENADVEVDKVPTVDDEKKSHKSPVYEKTWFWGAVGLVGAGAVIMLSDSDDNTDEPATIDVIVEWE